MITLATLHEYSPQEVFDFVKNHLFTQGVQSMGEFGVYHRYDGSKCAAGCLISEQEYSPKFEGKCWLDLVCWGFVPDAHVDLISDLQRVHDNHVPKFWERELRKVALKHNLTY